MLKAARQKIVALLSSHWIKELNDITEAVNALKNYVGYFRLDLGLITDFGPLQAARQIQDCGGKVFLGLDLDDSPSSIKRALEVCQKNNISITTVSASIGPKALKQAAQNNREQSAGKQKTMLFSNLSPHFFETSDFSLVYSDNDRSKVSQFANWTKDGGLDGIILSSRYLDLLKNGQYKGLAKMVFDVRLNKEITNKRRQTMPIKEAVEKGADFFMIGHPIINRETGKADPAAAEKFAAEISSAMK
jgi:orotidine-5'-phosphate decarboxylase